MVPRSLIDWHSHAILVGRHFVSSDGGLTPIQCLLRVESRIHDECYAFLPPEQFTRLAHSLVSVLQKQGWHVVK